MRRPEIQDIYQEWINHVRHEHPSEYDKFEKLYKRYAL